jgi:hypothetical protein
MCPGRVTLHALSVPALLISFGQYGLLDLIFLLLQYLLGAHRAKNSVYVLTI